MFEEKNIFDLPLKGLGLPDFNDPSSSFMPNQTIIKVGMTVSDMSGFSDALSLQAGSIFTTLNVYYKLYLDRIKNPDPLKPFEYHSQFEETMAIDLAMSLANYLGSIWAKYREKDIRTIFDHNNATEVFRRLDGFLSMVSGILKPLIQPFKEEQKAAEAAKKAEFVIHRVVEHLNCHTDYYTEKYLDYNARLTSFISIQEFIKNLFENNLDEGNEFLQVFDIERAFLSRNDIIVPLRLDKTHEDIKPFAKEIDWTKEDLDQIKLGIRSQISIEVPFDGIHLEPIRGECPLPGVPSRSKYSIDADLSIKTKEKE